jgi:NADPH:quinone reductase-like Zn-dependent oxidoreductase
MKAAAMDNHTHETQDAQSTMRAIVQQHYGTDPAVVLELADVPRPTIADNEVLVRVAAASVDMGTWHCMTGMPYAMRLAGFGVRAPKAANPGRAFAGTVALVGADVTGFQAGDMVYGTCAGSFAEYARVAPKQLAAMPANLSFEQAAAAPISGVTALQAIRRADVQRDHKVLVVGASGGVGTFAVQMAKALGAEVTGVCSTPKVELVRALGADHVVDYTVEDFATGAVRYDVIIDTGGNRRLTDLRGALTARGTLVIVGGETGGHWLGGFERSLAAVLLSIVVKQQLRMLASTENADDLDALRELIEAGGVTPAIDRSYQLGEAGDAIARVYAGDALGKVVVVND